MVNYAARGLKGAKTDPEITIKDDFLDQVGRAVMGVKSQKVGNKNTTNRNSKQIQT